MINYLKQSRFWMAWNMLLNTFWRNNLGPDTLSNFPSDPSHWHRMPASNPALTLDPTVGSKKVSIQIGTIPSRPPVVTPGPPYTFGNHWHIHLLSITCSKDPWYATTVHATSLLYTLCVSSGMVVTNYYWIYFLSVISLVLEYALHHVIYYSPSF